MLLSGLVIFSYLFDIFSRKTKVPSVLLLLATGVGLQLLANAFQFKIVDFNKVLPLLGTIGLILIVLEGALELHYTKEKKRIILQSLGASFFLLVASSPLTRSSHHAGDDFQQLRAAREAQLAAAS